MFTAFDAARGDVLMILDADLTMPPEQLPKFWEAMRAGKGEFINGSRLVYPMEDERDALPQSHRQQDLLRSVLVAAQPALHRHAVRHQGAAPHATICGSRPARAYFGDFDPFGDFDLIFGASKLNLKSVEMPIRYAARSYGETQISRFRHGCHAAAHGRVRVLPHQGAVIVTS